MTIQKEKIALLLIGASAITVLAALLSRAPVPQDLTYHDFSDVVSLFNIPNILNMLSNLPFLIIGLLGLYKLINTHSLTIVSENKLSYFAFFWNYPSCFWLRLLSFLARQPNIGMG